MTTITVNELALNLRKYLDFAKSESFILNDNDELFTLTLKRKKSKVRSRPATPEELELIREGEENFAKGNYYAQRDDETVDEFIDRMLREED